MYKLPPSDSPLRELFDVEEFAVMAAPSNRARMLPAYAQLVVSLRKFVAETDACGAAGVAMRANGDIVLIECGPRGGIQERWNFSR